MGASANATNFGETAARWGRSWHSMLWPMTWSKPSQNESSLGKLAFTVEFTTRLGVSGSCVTAAKAKIRAFSGSTSRSMETQRPKISACLVFATVFMFGMPTASLQVFEELTFCGRERKVFRYFQSRGVVHKLRHASGTRAIKRNSMAEEGVNNLNQRFLTQADTQQIADELCVIQFSEKTYICMNLVAREATVNISRHVSQSLKYPKYY